MPVMEVRPVPVGMTRRLMGMLVRMPRSGVAARRVRVIVVTVVVAMGVGVLHAFVRVLVVMVLAMPEPDRRGHHQRGSGVLRPERFAQQRG